MLQRYPFPTTDNRELLEGLVSELGDVFGGWSASIVTEIDEQGHCIQWDSDSGRKHVVITPYMKENRPLVHVYGWMQYDADKPTFSYTLNWIPSLDETAQYHMLVQTILSTWQRYVDLWDETPAMLPLNRRDKTYQAELDLANAFKRKEWKAITNYYEGGMTLLPEAQKYRRLACFSMLPPWDIEDEGDGLMCITFEYSDGNRIEELFYKMTWPYGMDINAWLRIAYKLCALVEATPGRLVTETEVDQAVGK